MKKHVYPIVNIGSALLFMTFIVLCLATLAVLSLSGSVKEYQDSQKLAAHNRSYYQACGQASERLQEIDEALEAAYADSPSRYYEEAERRLADLEGITADFSQEDPTIAYEIPASRSQNLQVVLTLRPSEKMANGYYKITTWKEVPSTEWNGNDKLNLM